MALHILRFPLKIELAREHASSQWTLTLAGGRAMGHRDPFAVDLIGAFDSDDGDVIGQDPDLHLVGRTQTKECDAPIGQTLVS